MGPSAGNGGRGPGSCAAASSTCAAWTSRPARRRWCDGAGPGRGPRARRPALRPRSARPRRADRRGARPVRAPSAAARRGRAGRPLLALPGRGPRGGGGRRAPSSPPTAARRTPRSTTTSTRSTSRPTGWTSASGCATRSSRRCRRPSSAARTAPASARPAARPGPTAATAPMRRPTHAGAPSSRSQSGCAAGRISERALPRERALRYPSASPTERGTLGRPQAQDLQAASRHASRHPRDRRRAPGTLPALPEPGAHAPRLRRVRLLPRPSGRGDRAVAIAAGPRVPR